MSQYLSSFIIDPVIRQARRFSNSPHQEPRPLFTSDEVPPRSTALETAPTEAREASFPARVSADDITSYTENHNQQVLPLATVDRLENRELQPWEDEIITNESEVGLADNGGESEGTPHNSSHAASNSQRSTTSSFSNSARSLMDATMSSADSSAQTSRSNAQDSRSRGESESSRTGDGALPADDGMTNLRKRIIAIQRTDSSNELKARLVHGVMTEKHMLEQGLCGPEGRSPISIPSSDHQFTPSSPKSMASLGQCVSPPTSSSSKTDPANPFFLSPHDLQPTYYQKPDRQTRDSGQDESLMQTEESSKELGCEHYKRNIKLQCSACNRWYTCRFCHDAVEDHMLNRRETKNMLCMLCGCAQPASEECTLCSERAAWYYCDVCKLWDDDAEKSIYHCNDCGICRIGQGLGKDFFHCKVNRTYPHAGIY